MLAVCFFVESRADCGRQIRTEQWLSICRSFDVDRQLVIDRTGKPCFSPAEDPEHPAEVFETFDAVVNAYPNAHYVMVERQGPVEPTLLPNYEHPEGDVIYVFGPDSGGIESLKPPSADWIQIPMSDRTRWGMWATVAGTVVMRDRWLRGYNR